MHALHKLQTADDAGTRPCHSQHEAGQKRAVKDLFAVQGRIIERMREILGQRACTAARHPCHRTNVTTHRGSRPGWHSRRALWVKHRRAPSGKRTQRHYVRLAIASAVPGTVPGVRRRSKNSCSRTCFGEAPWSHFHGDFARESRQDLRPRVPRSCIEECISSRSPVRGCAETSTPVRTGDAARLADAGIGSAVSAAAAEQVEFAQRQARRETGARHFA